MITRHLLVLMWSKWTTVVTNKMNIFFHSKNHHSPLEWSPWSLYLEIYQMAKYLCTQDPHILKRPAVYLLEISDSSWRQEWMPWRMTDLLALHLWHLSTDVPVCHPIKLMPEDKSDKQQNQSAHFFICNQSKIFPHIWYPTINRFEVIKTLFQSICDQLSVKHCLIHFFRAEASRLILPLQVRRQHWKMEMVIGHLPTTWQESELMFCNNGLLYHSVIIAVSWLWAMLANPRVLLFGAD